MYVNVFDELVICEGFFLHYIQFVLRWAPASPFPHLQ